MGALELAAGAIRASQGTFSSIKPVTRVINKMSKNETSLDHAKIILGVSGLASRRNSGLLAHLSR